MNLLMGIDQGGTKTLVAICRPDGQILATGRDDGFADTGTDGGNAAVSTDDGCTDASTDGGNADTIMNVGLERTSRDIWHMDKNMHRIRLAVDDALASSEVRQAGTVTDIRVGFNGADWPEEYPAIEARLRRTLLSPRPANEFLSTELVARNASLYLVNDCIGALRGGTSARAAVVLCVGTGLNVAVRDEHGNEFIYGYYIHDEDHGAGALGREAMRAVVDASIGLSEPTSLRKPVLDLMNKPSEEVLHRDWTIGGYRFETKHLAPVLLHAAEQGDPPAARITADYGERIARYATAAMRRLNLLDQPLDIVFSGSVLKDRGQCIVEAAMRVIREAAPRSRAIQARYEPAAGLLLLGLDSLYPNGIPMDVLDRFGRTAGHHGLLRQAETMDFERTQP